MARADGRSTIVCRAIAFDLDGVLADSRAVVERHWREFAAAHGLDFARMQRELHGRRSVENVKAFAPGLDAAREASAIDRRQVGDSDGVQPIAGARALIAQLPGARWAVVTSGSRELAEARLAAARLPRPDVLVTADDVAAGKPDPDGYRVAAERLATRPKQCLAVEDAPAGIEAARRAGLRVLGLTTTHDVRELGRADWVAASLADVDAAIRDRGLVLRGPLTERGSSR